MSASAEPAREPVLTPLATANTSLQYITPLPHIGSNCTGTTCVCGIEEAKRGLSKYVQYARAFRDVRRD